MIYYCWLRLQLTSASGASKTHDTAFRVVEKPKLDSTQGSPAKQSSASNRVSPKGPLPPVNTRRKANKIDVSDFLVQSSQEAKVVPSSRTLARSAFKEGRKTISEFVNDTKEIKPLGSISKPVTHHKETRTSSPSRGATSIDYASGSASIRRSRIPEDSSEVRYPLDLSAGSSGFRRIRAIENRIPTPEGRRSGLLVSIVPCVTLFFSLQKCRRGRRNCSELLLVIFQTPKCSQWQWRIQGRGGEGVPLFLDQIEA